MKITSYPKKVLVVAMLNSIHTVRWLSQFEDQKSYDIHLYSSTECIPHPKVLSYKYFTIHTGDLEKLIGDLKPDIIHTLEMQHSAYLVLQIREKSIDFPLWFYSCWGSDIKWFKKFPKDREKISKILKYIDAMFSEEIESIDIAIKKFKFNKRYLKVPGPGGFKVDEMRSLTKFIDPSKRKIIAVKGYSGWVYKPETVFSALILCSDLIKIKGFEVEIYVPGDISTYVNKLRESGVIVNYFNWTPNYNEMLCLFAKSRINIAASLSDGVPNSMLEGMLMGAFPIQSKSKTLGEYIKRKNGILIDPLDIVSYAEAIKKSLEDDNLVDEAAVFNLNLIKNKFDYNLIKNKVIDFYGSFFEDEKTNYDILLVFRKAYWNNVYRELVGSRNIIRNLKDRSFNWLRLCKSNLKILLRIIFYKIDKIIPSRIRKNVKKILVRTINRINMLGNRNKISVIIPCYNQGKFIDDAVNSVLMQTYKKFEIIIINDGSDDEFTNKLLKNYKRKNTKVYFTKNNGLAETRNFGYSKAKGQFIQFLDADDYISSDKFEKQISSFKNNKNIDVSYTGYEHLIDSTGQKVKMGTPVRLGDDPYLDFLYKWQRGLSVPIHCGLFRKSIWEEEKPFITGFKAVEDWIMWTSVARKKCKFYYVDEVCATYRLHKGGMTKNKSFMIYWATRAISYIADNLVETTERERFNCESEKYVEHLINIFYIKELKDKIKKLKK